MAYDPRYDYGPGYGSGVQGPSYPAGTPNPGGTPYGGQPPAGSSYTPYPPYSAYPYGGPMPQGRPGYSYGGGPIVPQPYVYRPPQDPTEPIETFTGRPLTWEQFWSVQMYGDRPAQDKPRKWLTWVTFVLSVLLFFRILFLFRLLYPYDWSSWLFLAWEFLALAASGTVLIAFYHRQRRTVGRQYQNYQRKMPELFRIEWYADRVVQSIGTETIAIPFSMVCRVVETADHLTIYGPDEWITWRAGDLTPYQTEALKVCLHYHVPPTHMRIQSALRPSLYQALRIPQKSEKEPALVTMSASEKSSYTKRLIRPFVENGLPLMILLAGVEAIELFLSPYLLVDAWIYSGINIGVLLLVLLVYIGIAAAARKGKSSGTVLLDVTPSGLLIRRNMAESSYPREWLVVPSSVQAVDKGKTIVLKTSAGTYTVAWTAVSDPELLRRILFL